MTLSLSQIRHWGAGFVQAWKSLPVVVGFLGTLAIAIGSLSSAYLPQASPFWIYIRALHMDGEVGKVGGTVVTIIGVFLLVNAWFRLRHSVYRKVNYLWILFIWSMPFLFAPPIFSHDAYSYAAQGWMVHNGINPYDAGPGVLPGPFADMVNWVWRYTPAPYGPLSLQIQHLMVDLSGFSPQIAVFLLRVPSVISVGLIVVLLPKIAKAMDFDPNPVIWFACLNPIMMVDFIGGEHNDGWMMGLLILGLWVATHRKWWPLAAVIVGIAASIKQPAIFATWALPLLTVPLSRWGNIKEAAVAVGKAVICFVIGCGTFVLITWATGLGYGWIAAAKVPGMVGSISPRWIIGFSIQALTDPDNTQYITMTGNVIMVLGAIAIVWFIIHWGPQQPLKALSWSYMALALSAGTMHSWYTMWGFLLFPLYKGRKRLAWIAAVLIVCLLCYSASKVGMRNGATIGTGTGLSNWPWPEIIAYAVVPLWLLQVLLRHKLWKSPLEDTSAIRDAPSSAGQGDDGDLGGSADADGRAPGADTTGNDNRDAVEGVHTV